MPYLDSETVARIMASRTAKAKARTVSDSEPIRMIPLGVALLLLVLAVISAALGEPEARETLSEAGVIAGLIYLAFLFAHSLTRD